MSQPSTFQAAVERWCLDTLPIARCCCPEQPSSECPVTAHRELAEHVVAQVDPGEAREIARRQQGLLERVLGVEPTQRDYALAGTKVAR